MALQYSVAVRNAQLQAVETTIGATARLRLRTGAPPTNCAAARTGTVLAELTLPADYMDAPASGSVARLGAWSGTGSAAGNVGHFEIVDNAGTTCHLQGNVTATGGGGDMTMDNINVAIGQVITVNTFTIAAANA